MLGQQPLSLDDEAARDEIKKAAQAAADLLREAKSEMQRHPVSAGIMVNDAIKQVERILRLAGVPAPKPELLPWQRKQRPT